MRHDPNAANGVGRGVGKIDVDEGVRLPFRSKQALQNERRIFLRCFPRYLAARREHLAQCHRRHAQQGSFHRGSGCTRIGDVFGEIGAAIDARQKNGRTHFHDLVDCEKRAVGRRALDREMPTVDFAHANRDVHGNRMRGARFLLVGGNDPDILGELADDLFLAKECRSRGCRHH